MSTLIDWSDPDVMLGLLCEYVADEKSDAHDDQERATFLAELLADLAGLAGRAPGMPADEIIEELRAIDALQRSDFANDPVLTHVAACIEELERIQSDVIGIRSAAT
jgi:hypothetical protein